MSNYLITNAQIAAGGTFTSAPVNIEKALACAVHLQALVGAAPDVGFTYSVSTSSDGVFVPGEATISASRSVISVSDFAPEPASFIKIIVTNNNGAAVVTPTVVLSVQDAD
jgi:hypothetical protein